MEQRLIRVRGAREHTLQNVSVDLPRDRLVVLTGLSGSGKSSLAFDTIYAEGKRRYVESLSSYARQVFERLDRPDIDYIEGLPPTIAIEQRHGSSNPRSTVATITEIHDYLRLLFARAGCAVCPSCQGPLHVATQDELVDQLLQIPKNRRFMLLAPLGASVADFELRPRLERVRRDGFVRARVDGEIWSLTDLDARLGRKASKTGRARAKPRRAPRTHRVEVVVDRLQSKPGGRQRVSESLETALQRGNGLCVAAVETPSVNGDGKLECRFVETPLSNRFACAGCQTLFPELEPRLFSFNTPDGACRECDGLGTRLELDEELIVPDRDLSLRQGAIEAWRRGGKRTAQAYTRRLEAFAEAFSIPLDAPYRNLPAKIREILLRGTPSLKAEKGPPKTETGGAAATKKAGYAFEGVIPALRQRYEKTESQQVKARIHQYMSAHPCPSCRGSRLRPEALAVTVGPDAQGTRRSIAAVLSLSVDRALAWSEGLELEGDAAEIGPRILSGVSHRLRFMREVGVGYLTLDRAAATLSGGELQRIRLAAQIGSGLAGVCYVLDEPTIGLHPRDNARLLQTLVGLRDAGNTVIVVEHDEQTIRAADHVIDMGPGAGLNGGEVVYEGTVEGLLGSSRSLTAAYLKGELEVNRPRRRRRFKHRIEVRGARENNLKNLHVRFPLGGLVCVTGVSGSGKSTLVRDVLYKGLARKLHRAVGRAGAHDQIKGATWIDRVVEIDQSPIGRSLRSNPATFSGVFSQLRRLFATLKEARIRGYAPSRFSFNVKGGRCEACQGQGFKRVEMHFLPDMCIRCDQCAGRRYQREVLEVRYKGLSVADVLDLTIEESRRLFHAFPRIRDPLRTIEEVGLGYLKLGQPSTTLSGGEAQRLKLASELWRTGSGHTLYLLDEPTTGLHFADISRLMSVLDRLAHGGKNTVCVIEHNLDVIACADWIIDLGPEGGDAGGELVAEGPPEAIAACPRSETGRFLRQRFQKKAAQAEVA